MKTLLHLLRIFTVLYIAGAIAFLYFYEIDGWNAPKYTNLPFPTSQSVYHAGERFAFTIGACHDRTYRLTVNAAFVDGFIVQLSPIEGVTMGTGCTVRTSNDFTVPSFLPPGKYRVHGQTCYHINFLRDRCEDWDTQEFTVVP